ncbi:PEP-CTERM sorting domain-containing protein [Rubripirellula amarantea]
MRCEGTHQVNARASVVPEPSSFLILAIFGLSGFVRARKSCSLSMKD